MQETQANAPTTVLLTIPQVAHRLGVSRGHVYTLIRAGLPVTPLGRLKRISEASLCAWLAQQEQTKHHQL